MGDTNIGTLAAKLTLQTADFVTGADGAISKIGAISQAFQAIGGAAVKVAKQGSSAAMEFETAFTGVQKTVNAPAGNATYFTDLKGQIIDLSTELPSTATEIANVAATAGQLGISSDNLMDFTTVMLQLASATNLSSEEAATKLAQFANVTGTSADDYGRLGSTVVELGNNMATTEKDIVNFGQEMALAGTSAGMSEAQILGWGAAMSSMGLEAASSGTAFQRFTADVTGAVAGTNNHLETFASVSGMTAEEFATAWETDASGAMQTFLAGVGQLGSAEQLKVWDDLGINQQQEIQMLGSLASNTDLVTQALGMSNSAWAENTALTTEANAANQTTAAKLQMIRNTTEALAISIGDVLLPIISDVLEAVKPVITQITTFVKNHPKLTKGILGVAAAIGAIGTVLPFLANMVTAVNTLSKVKALAGIGKLIGGIGSALSGVFSGIAGAVSAAIPAIVSFISSILPIIAVIAAVIAAILLLKHAYDSNFLGMKDKLEPFVSGFKSACSAVGGYFSSLADTFKSEGVSGVFEKVKTDVTNLWEGTLQPKLTEIKDKVVQWLADFDLGEALSTLASTIGTAISGWWESTVSPALSTLGTNIKNFFGSIDLGAALSTLASAIGVAVGGWWTLTLLPAFENIATSISDFFGAIDLGGALGKVAGTIGTAVGGWWENTIKPAFGDIGQNFADFFGGIDLGQIGADLIETLKTGISNAWESLKTWFSGLISNWNPIGDVTSFFGGLFGGNGETTQQTAAAVGDNGKTAKQAVVGEKPGITSAGETIEPTTINAPSSAMSLDTAALAPVPEEVIASWQRLADAITAVNNAITGGGTAGTAGEASTGAAEGTAGGSGLVAMFGQIKTVMNELISVAALLGEELGTNLVTAATMLTNALCVISVGEDGSTSANNGNTLYNSLGAVFGVLSDILTTSRNIAEHWTGEFISATETMKRACGGAEGVVQSLSDSAGSAADQFNAMADAIWAVVEALEALNSMGGGSSALASALSNSQTNSGDRGIHDLFYASGGQVTGGRTIVVGEEGPELFTPSRSGYIIPNDELGGSGSGTVINVTFSGDVIGDERSISAYVTRAVKAGIRQEVMYG